MNTSVAFDYLTGKKKIDYNLMDECSLHVAEEGIILLKNRDHALPLSVNEPTAFFGRLQKHYLVSGSGSGGSINVRFSRNIFEELKKKGLSLDEEVESFYDKFVEENPYDMNCGGWLHLPSQREPDLPEDLVIRAASRCTTALYVFGRMAGEGHDMIGGRGGYMLTEQELATFALLKKHFKKVILLCNNSGPFDFSEVKDFDVDAILELWTGGMLGATAAANVILGDVNPSGRLPDTIVDQLTNVPSHGNFCNAFNNVYQEDIYVGYRWFETFAPDHVTYPFGYGLSYTTFSIHSVSFASSEDGCRITAQVKNTGDRSGKQVVQCYFSAPQGKLGKPKMVLGDFVKTKELNPGEEETVSLFVSKEALASFDDRNYVYLLEKGVYSFFLGENVRDNIPCGSFTLDEDLILKKVESALAPVVSFQRYVNRDGKPVLEDVPLKKSTVEPTPETLPQIPKDDMKLSDVAEGRITMEEFVSRFTDEDLTRIVFGEGMGSPKVTPGSGAAFAGVSPSLTAMGIPTVCCCDGPSGLRMNSNARTTCVPSAICQASTWNKGDLIQNCYEQVGHELATWNVDMLLGPGVNIHRHPLCGRNFEYFSEDPLLAGRIAATNCLGLDKAGVSGVIKHFLANNVEVNRHGNNSVLSERAIREIYGKPFEICIKTTPVRGVMTSYNKVNGRWTSSHYDLTTRLLRNDFGFTGFVMTDWWANISAPDLTEDKEGFTNMVHAQNDVYMVVGDSSTVPNDLLKNLTNGTLTRGELQRSAINLCRFAVDSLSFMALQNGFGIADLKEKCETVSPIATLEIKDNKAVYESDNNSDKVILKMRYTSQIRHLDQENITLQLNTLPATVYTVSDTPEEGAWEYRSLALKNGKNEFVFTMDSSLVQIKELILYPFS